MATNPNITSGPYSQAMPAWESRSLVVWRFVGTIGPLSGWFVLGLAGCSYHLAGPLKFGKGAPGRGGLSSGWNWTGEWVLGGLRANQ